MSKPVYVACIVVACGILHNIAIRNGLELDLHEEDELAEPREVISQEEEEDADAINPGPNGNRLYVQGLYERDRIVQEDFNRR